MINTSTAGIARYRWARRVWYVGAGGLAVALFFSLAGLLVLPLLASVPLLATAVVAAVVLGRAGWPRSVLPIVAALVEGAIGWTAVRFAAGESPLGFVLFLVGVVLPLVIVTLAIAHCSAQIRARQVLSAA